ncbi:EpsG family protein [Escherichia coli]|uniref:EpsG family protein n=1 Tax=Escherichia coli TaxID=562 RepID=UPI0039FDC819
MTILFYNVLIIGSILVLYIPLSINNANYIKFFSFFLLFFISSVRVGIGTDYYSYENIFNLIEQGAQVGTEPIFYLINLISSKFDFGFRGVIVITSFLFLYPIFKCIDNRITIWVVFYFLMSFYLYSFNTIRQGIAISISCFSIYKLLIDGNKVKYIFIVFLASLFHSTALIGLLVLFFRKFCLPWWGNIILIVVFYFIAQSSISYLLNSSLFLSSKYSFYANTDYIDAAKLGSGVGLVIQLIPYFVIIVFHKYIFLSENISKFSVNTSMALIFVKILMLNIGIFYRFEYALIPMLSIVFSEIACRYNKSLINMFLFIYLFSWVVLQFELGLFNNANEIIPYQSIFGSF